MKAPPNAPRLGIPKLGRRSTRLRPFEAHHAPIHFFHTDHLGSTRVVTDIDGSVYERIDYLPFGEIFRDDVGQGGDYEKHRQKYTGQMYDYFTGLYYYGARYYDAETGRFTQADTIVPEPLDGQTFNRYTYVNNNPYKYVDPSGHNPFLAVVGMIVESIVVATVITVAAVAVAVAIISNDPTTKAVALGIASSSFMFALGVAAPEFAMCLSMMQNTIKAARGDGLALANVVVSLANLPCPFFKCDTVDGQPASLWENLLFRTFQRPPSENEMADIQAVTTRMKSREGGLKEIAETADEQNVKYAIYTGPKNRIKGQFMMGSDTIILNPEIFVRSPYQGAWDESVIAHELGHAYQYYRHKDDYNLATYKQSESFADACGIKYRAEFNRHYSFENTFDYAPDGVSLTRGKLLNKANKDGRYDYGIGKYNEYFNNSWNTP